MKLSIGQVKAISRGAVRIEEIDGYIRFFRFTEQQQELYRVTNADFYKKTFATAGIKLYFKTDSKQLFLKGKVTEGCTRKYFSIDVFVNGKPVGYVDNMSDVDLPQDYTKINLPMCEFSESFSLGYGEKTVCVYFPWSVCTHIEEISVDDGAFVGPVDLKKKLLAYGDSITHGYDAVRPSNRYISRLSEYLEAEEINKAIGGEVFFPPLAELKDDFEPDYITVAYGTNDWNKTDAQTFFENCKAFYGSVSNNYPNAKIFAVAPIWRKELTEYRKFGSFDLVEKNIRKAVADLKNVTVINAFDFVPKEEKYFADLRLHPNDAGFDFYFKNLCSEIKSYI